MPVSVESRAKAQRVPKKRTFLTVLLALVFIGVYVGAIVRNVNERRYRSLELVENVAVADHVNVSITVIRVDPTARQLTARIRLQLRGSIAQDVVTPKVDLRFLVNNSPGQQVFEFPKGEAVTRIEATLPMEGDLNRYPFDRYETNIWLLVDTPVKSKQSPVSAAALATPPTIATTSTTPAAEALAPDIETGEIIRKNEINATRIHLNLSRPYNLVNASIVVMVLMMSIALTAVAMVLKAIVSRGDKLDVLPMSLCIGLIFGLPALRNIQPGVPPVGILGDYFSFIWAEMFVASAAIIMAWIWVIRAQKEPETSADVEIAAGESAESEGERR